MKLRALVAMLLVTATLLVVVVGCARPPVDKGFPAPPDATPAAKAVKVVMGERLDIERSQAALLQYNGSALRLPENIHAINWSHAAIDYPTIYLFSWEQGESFLLDIYTGETLATSTALTTALRANWALVTANKFGAFSDHRFGLTHWASHAHTVATVTVFRDGGVSDGSMQVGERWQSFMLSTAPGASAITIVGTVSVSGEVMFFRALRGRGIGLAWSPQGGYVALTLDEGPATVLHAYRCGSLDPIFTLTPRDIERALGTAQQVSMEASSVHWTVDERMLHFRAFSDKPEASRTLSVYSDGTRLVAMPDSEMGEEGFRQMQDAITAYRAAVKQRSQVLLAELPEEIVLDMTRERLLLRQNAHEFLQEPHLLDLGGVFLALERGAHLAPLVPQTLRVWHDSNHYQGKILVFLDAQGRRLAEVALHELAHWNVLFRPVEIDLSQVLPRFGSGYIVVLTTSAKDGVMPLEGGAQLPVRFR